MGRSASELRLLFEDYYKDGVKVENKLQCTIVIEKNGISSVCTGNCAVSLDLEFLFNLFLFITYHCLLPE